MLAQSSLLTTEDFREGAPRSRSAATRSSRADNTTGCSPAAAKLTHFVGKPPAFARLSIDAWRSH